MVLEIPLVVSRLTLIFLKKDARMEWLRSRKIFFIQLYEKNPAGCQGGVIERGVIFEKSA